MSGIRNSAGIAGGGDPDDVHELAHLLEPTHNMRFIALMDRFMPIWPGRRDQLNQLPVRHEDWGY